MIAASGLQLLDFLLPEHGTRLLDMNTHASVFGAVSLLALAVAWVTSALLAANGATGGRAVVTLPFLLAILLGLRLLHPSGVVVIALPFVAVAFVILWSRVAPGESDERRLLRVGCVVLAVSYLLHALTESAPGSGGDEGAWESQARLLLRHGAELAGWMVVATALVAVFAGSLERR